MIREGLIAGILSQEGVSGRSATKAGATQESDSMPLFLGHEE